MRFAISLLSLRPGRVGGAETYVRQLLSNVAEHAADDELIVVTHPGAAGVETPGMKRILVPRRDAVLVGERLLEAYTPYRATSIERTFASLGADGVLFPQQSIFPKRARVRAVLTVVDVQHLVNPEYFGVFDRTYRAAVYPSSMARAERIIAISEFTKRMLVERCGVPPDKISVVPLGFSPTSTAGVTPHRGIDGPYLYFPAASYPHKGHDRLFRSYATLRQAGRVDARLVLTGERTAHWKVLARLTRELGIYGDVVHLGFVPYSEVRSLYVGATAVVFPSRFEGFGIPVLEAAAYGKPVLTSRLEVFDEIGVPSRFQIDFSDPEQLAAALERAEPTRIEKRPLSWSEVARMTLDVMRDTRR